LSKVDVLDKKLFPFYEDVSRKGLSILFDSYCTPISDMPLEKIRPIVYSKLAATFPSLKIILAHCGMPFLWEAYLVLKGYGNVFADLSHILSYFRDTSLIQDLGWVVKKIPNKFLYGSDFPEAGISTYYEDSEKFCKAYDIPFRDIINNFHRVISYVT